MIPIEYYCLTLLLAFGVIGVVRKFPRELGATVGFVAMLFLLALGASYASDFVYNTVWGRSAEAGPDAALVRWFLIMGFIFACVLIIYAGQTLTYPGRWPPNPFAGFIFDLTIGLFNGWLVVWTAWWFTYQLGYPNSAMGVLIPEFTERSERWVQYAPLGIIPEQYAIWVIGGFLAVLILLRVIR